MKEIESLYIIVSVENDEENIMGFGTGMQMQCASSNRGLMMAAQENFQKNFPNRKYELIKFNRDRMK